MKPFPTFVLTALVVYVEVYGEQSVKNSDNKDAFDLTNTQEDVRYVFQLRFSSTNSVIITQSYFYKYAYLCVQTIRIQIMFI